MKQVDTSPQTDSKALREGFFALKDRKDVAALLEIDYSHLTFLVHRSHKSLRYAHFTIPKSGGGSRDIMAPNRSLKILQAKLARILVNVYRPKAAAHGFLPDKSVVTNANYHCGRAMVFNADLKNFFPSINFGRVRGMFMAKPYKLPESVATLIAQICCFDNKLPQGAPTSPIISNMICARLDSELQRLAALYKCRYTRYADDITFSAYRTEFPESIGRSILGGRAEAGHELSEIVQSNGFSINADKVRMQRWDSHQEVTGLTVNRVPNVRRTFVRQIRAMIHAWKVHGYDAAEREHRERYREGKHRAPGMPPISHEQVIEGKIAYLSMVRGSSNEIVRKLRKAFDGLKSYIDPESVSPKSPPKSIPDMVRDAMWVLECDNEDCNQGTAFVLRDRGLITCAHVLCEHVSLGKMKAFRPTDVTNRYPVKIITSHAIIDLAILEMPELANASLEMLLEDEMNDHAQILIGGFPNYKWGDSGVVVPGVVVGFRPMSGIRRAMVSAPIVRGASGGPVVNQQGIVVGVAVTGADSMENTVDTEKHGVVPIHALSYLLESPKLPS